MSSWLCSMFAACLLDVDLQPLSRPLLFWLVSRWQQNLTQFKNSASASSTKNDKLTVVLKLSKSLDKLDRVFCAPKMPCVREAERKPYTYQKVGQTACHTVQSVYTGLLRGLKDLAAKKKRKRKEKKTPPTSLLQVFVLLQVSLKITLARSGCRRNLLTRLCETKRGATKAVETLQEGDTCMRANLFIRIRVTH